MYLSNFRDTRKEIYANESYPNVAHFDFLKSVINHPKPSGYYMHRQV
jgi:hypothetical protein